MPCSIPMLEQVEIDAPQGIMPQVLMQFGRIEWQRLSHAKLHQYQAAGIVVRPTQVSYHRTVPETSIPTSPGFAELSKAEQVRYLQALWDQISEHPDEIPVPESHLQLAEERLRRYRESPSSARPAFEVIDRLSQSRK